METLRRLSSYVVSEKYVPVLERLFYKVTARLYEGESVVCPCCDGHFRQFLSFHDKPNSRCPGCGSAKRHRMIWLYLKERTNFFTTRLKVLHFAPEYLFQKNFETMPNLDYFSADLNSPRSRVKMDITDIQFKDNSFDVIITNHVLEHVEDDRRAMKELYRVLKPGGFAILQSPVNRHLEKTFEDPSITSPRDRKKAFGQEDHVRIYGLDYKDRLEEAGFTVNPENFVSELGPERIRKHVLRADEPVYRCTK